MLERMLAIVERGKPVCPVCINSEDLGQQLRQHETSGVCAYCKCVSERCVDLGYLVQVIRRTADLCFADPAMAGVPRNDGEWQCGEGSLYSAFDILDEFELDFPERLHGEIASSLSDGVLPCAHGSWHGRHFDQEMSDAWELLVSLTSDDDYGDLSSVLQTNLSEVLDPQGVSLGEFLCQTGTTLSEVGAIVELKTGTPLFRAHCHTDGRQYDSFADVGPPPAAKAQNNRMSRAGVPVFYLAFDEATACDETRHSPEDKLVLASFCVTVPILVADLTALPVIPSIFDVDAYDRRKSLQFLHKFRDEVSKKVSSTRRSCEYRPTQIFCEALRLENYHFPLNGFVYPSSEHLNGRNLALFKKAQRPFENLVKWIPPVKHHGCRQ
jgi:hypothetical protein